MISQNGKLINNNWVYRANGKAENVDIPHTTKEVSFNYFDEKSYQKISEYEKNIFVNENSKRIFLKFDGVMTAFELFINDKMVKECRGGYIPHVIEITEFVQKGKENKVLAKVDSTERKDIPPFGNVIDYLTFGGIYRDVYYYEMENCFIKNIFYKYEVEEIKNGKGKIKIMPQVVINSLEGGEKASVEIDVAGKSFKHSLECKKGEHKYSLDAFCLEDINLWSIDCPNLHKAEARLILDKNIVDKNNIKLGFRKLKIDSTGIYINDEKIKLIGLNRHQSFPYVGYAMPKRAQEKDADILKNELKLNTVRSSHYPPSPYFLNRCDEIGLLVLEEIPGWQFVSGDEAWREQALADVKGMIERDYNYASVITWGVRINESWDDKELYTKTNEIAHSLDDTRLTSGIRCIERSEFLEDIYTMNDFAHNGGEQILRPQQQVTGLDKKVPYIITEFCGHIYPTKRYDNQEKLTEHTLRHARVQSSAMLGDDYLGAIGWCAFDYNTHYDFGSGDRICYHGVMDMYRMPKFASYIYKSQAKREDEIVIEPLTYWSRGELREAMVFPMYVCTNCDEIEVIIGGETRGIFKRNEETIKENLKGLKYPPICIQTPSGDWGSKWSDIEFIGFIDGKAVKSKKFCANPIVEDVCVVADDDTICGGEFDTTRISVKAVDKEGNILPYVQGALQIETDAGVDIIGDTLLPFTGGAIAFWVKTSSFKTENKANIKIKTSFGITKEIIINIKNK